MTENMKKIKELREQISYIEFKEHLSKEDYATIRKLKEEIKKINIEDHGVCIQLVFAGPQYSKTPFYFTGDETLSCGDEPTWFENEEEAMFLFKKSSLYQNRSEYIIELIKR